MKDRGHDGAMAELFLQDGEPAAVPVAQRQMAQAHGGAVGPQEHHAAT